MVVRHRLGWNGTAWAPLDPQPQINFGVLAGTVCDGRGHHDLDGVGEHHLLCGDCGEITEVFRVG